MQWNRVLMETVLTPGQHPATIMQVRSYSMMHAAMFDAVNSIEGSHTAYLTDVPGTPNASIQAAAAQAAHDILVGLYPPACSNLRCRTGQLASGDRRLSRPARYQSRSDRCGTNVGYSRQRWLDDHAAFVQSAGDSW